MSFVISSVLPFPNILWWCKIQVVQTVCWDISEYFEKMSYRNRYYIAGAGGILKMSLPIEGGRERKAIINNVHIASAEDWQKRHWRTITTAYNNAPYFEYYAATLEKLFMQKFDKLADFSIASVQWLKLQTGISFDEQWATTYHKQYPDSIYDLRTMKPGYETCDRCDFPLYYQAFMERTGFIPNLSLLDLLFAEGPFTKKWLEENKETVISWAGKQV